MESKMHWNYPKEWIDNWKDDLVLSPKHFKDFAINKLVINERITGFCAISESEENYEIEHLWMLPDFMGKGFGKLLLKTSLNKVATNNKKIIVTSDPNSELFYKKMGFTTFSKVESYPKGRFLPIMKKEKE